VKLEMIIYKTDDLLVRTLELSDQELLVKWLSDPRVLQYYEGRDRPQDLELVKENFYKEDEEVRCIFEYLDKSIGYIQFYLVDEETKKNYGLKDERIFGTDQFIGEVDYWNQGIGKKLIKSMLEYLTIHANADKVIMDPQVWNERAIKCYEGCGFKKIKILETHEWHEGQLRDCWLIEYSVK
jgi:aminoglycoside 6'-N-acetyltransferase